MGGDSRCRYSLAIEGTPWFEIGPNASYVYLQAQCQTKFIDFLNFARHLCHALRCTGSGSTARDRWRGAERYHTLEVELQFGDNLGDPGSLGFTTILPKFKEKGVLTIVEIDRGGRVF